MASAVGGGPSAALVGASRVKLLPDIATPCPGATTLGVCAYDGFITVNGSQPDTELRVPYWYAVTSTTLRTLTLFQPRGTTPRAGGSLTLLVRVADAAGVVIPDAQPTIQALSNSARAGLVSPSLDYPDVWEVNITMGPLPGANRFTLSAGEVSRTFSITTSN